MYTQPSLNQSLLQLPRWLLGIDGLITCLVFGFIAAYALSAHPPFGPAVAVAVALCFPSAMLLGIINGLALHGRDGGSAGETSE